MPRNLNWSSDEIIIVLDLYCRTYPKVPEKNSAELELIFNHLRNTRMKIDPSMSEDYRNTNTVYMKMMNFHAFNPVHLKKGLNDEINLEVSEGRISTGLHRKRGRNKKIVKLKKEKVLDTKGSLFCECCDFDFENKYGKRGKGFIECHHNTPISEIDVETKTKLDDLSLVCSNCHSIIHRKRPWLAVTEVRDIITR